MAEEIYSPDAMAEEIGRVVLFGKKGSGKSTLTNMLVSGELNLDCPLAPIGNGVRGTTSTCKTYVGRGWTVTDTIGFSEPHCGTISVEDARMMVIDFLEEVRGRYSHIIFVHEKGRFDMLTTTIWETFRQIFTGREKNLVVLLTKVDDPSWLDENRADIERVFPECKQFLCVDFPRVDTDDPEMEESYVEMRQEKLEGLEKQMKEMFKDRPWVGPDIFKMGDAEIKSCVFGSVAQLDLVNLEDDGFTANYAVSSIMTPTSVNPINLTLVLHACISDKKIFRDKLRKISNIHVKMKELGKKVKVHHRQCADLLQRSSEASKEIEALFRRYEINWEQYCLAPLMSTLDGLVSCMKAAKEVLCLCGDHNKEQKVALVALSSPAPYRDSFSHFALVLRDLDWSLDVFCFLLYNPEAGHATPSEQRYWLSKFSWCEDRCRLVFARDGENRVADAGGANSCLAVDNDRHARDREDLISYVDSRSLFSTLQNRRYKSFMRNRLQGDSSFSDLNRIPDCFWISEELDYTMILHVGGGSYKAVYACKWLGMKVAIATFHHGGESFRVLLEAEARLLARVQHPNVVTFFGYFYDAKKQKGFLVTELVEMNLRSLINEHRSKHRVFSLSVSIDIMLQIAEAMVHVHGCGVIHRDLKALNCLVNRKCNGGEGFIVKVIDFGESNLRSTEMGSNFRTKNRGTSAWMAPEVHEKGGDEIKEYTWSADVYSFGMSCYEIPTGAEQPFGEIRGRQLTEMVCAGYRPEIPAECPNDLVELMTKCWAQSPEERPSFKDIQQILWNCKLYHTIWDT